MKPLTILFIGDVVGKLGRRTIARLLPDLIKEYGFDLVIANGENIAHGRGVTGQTVRELQAAGVDFITTGDHCFDQPSALEECYGGTLPVLRPANYAAEVPGAGHAIITAGTHEILVINLIGRAFMSRHHECPFRAADEILALFTEKKFSAIIIDIHAEATAEKIALGHYLNGRISALLGTHTHVMTADHRITPARTGLMTDVGMTGAADGVIGVEAEPVIASFLSQIKRPHRLPQAGPAVLSAVRLAIDPATGHCLELEPIQRFVTIED